MIYYRKKFIIDFLIALTSYSNSMSLVFQFINLYLLLLFCIRVLRFSFYFPFLNPN